jgi:hypothetical protein
MSNTASMKAHHEPVASEVVLANLLNQSFILDYTPLCLRRRLTRAAPLHGSPPA